MSGIKKAQAACAQNTYAGRTQGERAASFWQELPKNTHKPRCGRAFLMWRPYRQHRQKHRPHQLPQVSGAMQEKRKNLTLQGGTQSASKPIEKRESHRSHADRAAGKCSKKKRFPAKGHRSQNTSAASPGASHRPHRHRRLTKPKCSALKAAAPDLARLCAAICKSRRQPSGGQYRSHRYPRTQAAHNQQ